MGKPRTALGKWIDSRGIKQGWLIEKTGLGRNTITWACNDPDYLPSGSTMAKIIRAVRIVEPEAKAEQFWKL